ncbi:MAG TPA: Asp-tRNA(Asn)/Glu-tRNA(Gln) amidotransferase subunit GatA [Pseudomonadales bacterium]|nr:Asp-tRNA(Asn)/Glu-tRNA(Gln) amidotransferase subunit GatA [Pseudomonadales bacterium]
MHQLTVAQIAQGLREKQFSSVEITQHYLNRIAAKDDTLRAFITVCPERALAQAAAADARLASGNAAPLTGIPIAHKDIFCTKGVKTTCASKMLDNFIAPYDATVVENLDRAGTVMLGKTNMDEFAMGSSNETSFYGTPRNPWDLDRVAGGSSGGSAAAVAAQLAPIASGTDTGGSIRQPASLCGLSGIKPTYGRVSRWGMIAFASSLDQAGVIARNAEDAALMLQDMASHDLKDSTNSDHPIDDFSAKLNQSLQGVRIGIPKQYFGTGLDSQTGDAVHGALEQYRAMGAELIEIDLPHTDLAVPAYYVIAPAEASANLSRFDGVRYGHRCDNPSDLMDLYMRSRAEGFGDEVKRRIMVGTYALSAGYYDAYFRKAQQVRRLISQDFQHAFSTVDFIAGPTCPQPAFKLGEKTSDPVAMYLEDIYTIPVSLAGLPAMSIPCGSSHGLPVGLQLIGRHFDEAGVLQLAHQYQLATDWHSRTPAGLE